MGVGDAANLLRVMTFNVRGSQHRDGENAWRRRAPLNIRAIDRHAPDLIGFQELQRGNFRSYETGLPDYGHALGPPYENWWPYAHDAIYWNPARLELVETGGFWLSETPEKRSRSWESSHVRAVNWARFRLLPGGAEFVHLNTHLDHASAPARAEGSKLVVRKLPDLGADGAPVVLTGDFNCGPGSAAYKTFAQAGFADAHLAAGNPPANTFHKFQGKGFVPKRPGREVRLDWILLRDGPRGGRWIVRSCTVVRDAEPPLYPSDHYPVVADLSLNTSPA